MNHADHVFTDLLRMLLGPNASTVPGRNGEVRRILCHSYTFTELPLVTLRKVFWRGALREMEWFLSGSNRILDLDPSIHHWWRPWVDGEGEIPNNYSVQFRDAYGREGSCDQVEYLLKGVREHPFSRRNVITTWNTGDMMSFRTPITNCHGTVIQCFVEPDNSIHLKTYQRSVDVMLGMTHNWVQYWALLTWLAHRCGRKVGSLMWEGGDCHLYQLHQEEARSLMELYDCGYAGPFPNLSLSYKPGDQLDFFADHFALEGIYDPLTDTRLEMVV